MEMSTTAFASNKMDSRRGAPPLASKTNILRSIFPEVTVKELEEILTQCDQDLKFCCYEIQKRLKLQQQISTFSKYKGSIVQLYREYEGECHYCRVPGAKSIAYGMNSDQMTVDDFQFLLERGWARCGKWIYLPSNHKVCCPTYTIRLDVDNFKPSKSHRRVKNRFERFLETGACKLTSQRKKTHVEIASKSLNISEQELLFYRNTILTAYQQATKKSQLHNIPTCTIENISITACGKKHHKNFACNLLMKLNLAKSIRDSIGKQLVIFIPSSLGAMYINGFINFNRDSSFGSSPAPQPKNENPTPKSITNLIEHTISGHTLQISLEDPIFTEEKFELYKHYQSVVHNSAESSSELQPEGFKDFLCKTPLISRPASSPADPECGFGSFHQMYRLDGDLIAIGVIDILPHCLSSTYFIYNPDYSYLALGVISALREIQFVKDVLLRCPDSPFRYYYLGYYVHTCSKVRYKSSYHPSEMLCPITLQWVSMEKVKKILDEKKYCRFGSEDAPRQPPAYSSAQLGQWIRSYSLIIGGTPCLLVNLTEESQKRIGGVLHEFVKLAGDDVAVRLSYFFS